MRSPKWRHRSILSLALLLVTVGASRVHAQGNAADAPIPPSTPRPQHERLMVFHGEWRNADTAASGFRERCDWLTGGRRVMVCRATATPSSGAAERLSIYTYRGRDSTYHLQVIFHGGQSFAYVGGPEGDVWKFGPASQSPEQRNRLRYTVTPFDGGLRFMEEATTDGGASWSVTEDYRHLRVRSAH